MTSPRPRRSRFTRKKNKNYVFILKKYLPLSQLDIAVSTNKRMIIERAKDLFKKLPKESRSEEELRQLKDIPDPIFYCIVIYDNNTGEVFDFHIIYDRTTLAGY